MTDISNQDFDLSSLPWLDQPSRQISEYVAGLDPQPEHPLELRNNLLHWMQFGFAVLPQAIEPELIDAYLKDVDELLSRYKEFSVYIDCDILHVEPISLLESDHVQAVREDRDRTHLRINDIHNYSIAAKKISLHPKVVETVQHIFKDQIVALQSLMFFRGSEQALHQDFAFVPSHIPSQLGATWVALEDIHPDSGPLLYVPGSHTLPKFEWGDGIFRTPESARNEADFDRFLREQAEINGLPVMEFCPKKGDVFIWHGALAHGGAPVRNPELTRKAYVTHYSQASTHFWDYRRRGEPAERVELNGGFFHKSPVDPDREDVLRHGEHI